MKNFLDSTITMTSNEYRPCLVNGQPAVFHRWADEEQIVLKTCSMQHFNKENFSDIKSFNNILVITPYTDFYKIKKVFGIVELSDGNVKRVEIKNIKFTDTYYLNFDSMNVATDIMNKTMNIPKPTEQEE